MLDRTAASGGCGPTVWHNAPAINGRGEILIGPADYPGGREALVFIPPGVLARVDEDTPRLSRAGWRMARWGPDAHGRILIDQTGPKAFAEVELGDVAEEIAARAPKWLSWLGRIVERQLRLEIGHMRAIDHAGERLPDAGPARMRVLAEAAQADAAFARAAEVAKDTCVYFQDGYFSQLCSTEFLVYHSRWQIVAHDRGELPPAAPRSELRRGRRRRDA